MEKLKMHSPNLTQNNIARIREIFPGCVTEALGKEGKMKLAIDFDQLRQELSDPSWKAHKSDTTSTGLASERRCLPQMHPSPKHCVPVREESVNFDNTKNLFIEGDNLEALKLLQETYLGKIKMIYIDPPYNTGNDFIYDDDFA